MNAITKALKHQEKSAFKKLKNAEIKKIASVKIGLNIKFWILNY